MTTEEIRTVLAVLKTAYPSSFKDLSDNDVRETVKLWKVMFEHEDVALVNAAVVALISSRTVGYTPAIGEICQKLRELKAPDFMNDQDAWSLVSRACRNGFYGYQEEFDRLPPDVQKAVGRPEQLHEWALIDSDTLETVVSSNFRKTYKTVLQRKEDLLRIPDSVRERLYGANTKRLESG